MQYINYEKLEKIKLNKSNFYVALDFDQTLTSPDGLSSWDACGFPLGDNFKKETEILFEKYGPIELDYTISFEEKNKAMIEWYYGNFELYYKYNLTKKDLEKLIHKVIFREGGKEFLNYMYKLNIPVIILSAGIGNIIELFLKKNNCLTNNVHIISNFIPFDKNGNIKKFKGELIHTLNKTMSGHISKEIYKKINNKKYRLLLGDFIEDKKIIPIEDWDKTISVRIFKS